MRTNGGQVVGQVAVNRTGKGGNQSVTDFQHSKVHFDFHAHIKDDVAIFFMLIRVAVKRIRSFSMKKSRSRSLEM